MLKCFNNFLIYFVYYFFRANAVLWWVWYIVPVAIAEARCEALCAPMVAARMV